MRLERKRESEVICSNWSLHSDDAPQNECWLVNCGHKRKTRGRSWLWSKFRTLFLTLTGMFCPRPAPSRPSISLAPQNNRHTDSDELRDSREQFQTQTFPTESGYRINSDRKSLEVKKQHRVKRQRKGIQKTGNTSMMFIITTITAVVVITWWFLWNYFGAYSHLAKCGHCTMPRKQKNRGEKVQWSSLVLTIEVFSSSSFL